jgi:PAS domain S-box-containing protein
MEERKSIELSTEGRHELDARFREVMDAAPVMIWISGRDKRCIWFNRPWLIFTGRTMAQELGDGWAQGVHREDFDACLEIYNRHFDARQDFRMQYRLRRHDGAYHWIDDTGIPRRGYDGRFLGYIGSCIDINEQREAQIELRRQLLEIAHLNRSATATELLAAIAHGINQPLAAIATSGSAGLRWLARPVPDLGETRTALWRIVGEAHRAGKAIETIRALLARDERVKVPLDINTLVREVLALLHPDLQKRHVSIETDLFAGLPWVLADKTQLQQVILNLVTNAAEAMESVADRVRILRVISEKETHAGVLITIEDSGPGVEPAKIERIFEPFYTTKCDGIGMGLRICQSIVEAHGGSLSASLGDPHGLCIRLSLPADGKSGE